MGWKKNYGDSDNDSPWNMAQLYVTRLDKINGEIDDALANADVLRGFRLVRTLFGNILPQLELQEKYNEPITDIKQRFIRIKNLLSSQKMAKLNYSTVEEELHNLRYLINRLQYDLELVEPKKDIKTWEELLEEEYA